MLSEEAQIGKQVRVRADHRSTTLRRLVGTIEKRWGDPTYIALDVLLDDGTVFGGYREALRGSPPCPLLRSARQC